MNFKKVVTVLLIVSMLFVQIVQPGYAQSNQVSKQELVVDGKNLEIVEINEGKGIIILHFNWEDGSKEKIIVQEKKNGEMLIDVTEKDGKSTKVERNTQGEVYINGVKEQVLKKVETTEHTDISTIAMPEFSIQSVDEPGGPGGYVPWSKYDTTRWNMTIVGGVFVTLVAVMLAGFGLGFAQNVCVAIVNLAFSLNLPELWFEKNRYYKLDGFNLKGKSEVWTFKFPNFTNVVSVDWSAEYDLR